MGNESLHVVWTQKKNTQTALISSPTSCQSTKDRTTLLWAFVGLKDKSKAQLSPAPHQALYFYVKGAWTEPTVRCAIIKHDGTRRAENIWPWWMGAGRTSKPPPPFLHRRGFPLISSWSRLLCLFRSITHMRDYLSRQYRHTVSHVLEWNAH